jgi:hypothetical protein
MLTAAAHAGVLPEQIGEFTCAQPSAPAPSDRALYAEFGFQASEQVTCSAAGQRFTVEAWRTQDSTGALALFQARRPAGATSSDLGKLAAQTAPGALLLATGNYVLQFTGHIPSAEELTALTLKLPQMEHSALPALADFLPSEELIPNSQRYILGPVSLDRFEPRIAPSLAAFSLGAEAQGGRYRTASGDLALAIFNYPTPGIARERQAEFLKQSGVLAKRDGPLVAVIVRAPDQDAAERVLARVQYKAGISWNQVQPKKGTDMGNLIVTGFILAGVIVGASLLAGLWLGSFKAILGKFGWRQKYEAFTVLRIRDK